MGYRSSWYLALTGDTAKKVNKQVEEISEEAAQKSESFLNLLKHAEKDVTSCGGVFFEEHDIKMYESYPEVAAFYAWLDTLDEDDYRYIELGEEEGDITHRGYNHELIYVSSTVERY